MNVYVCVIMKKTKKAACKVHDSVPQTVVNYLYFNQDPVKLSVKATGNTKMLCGPKRLPVLQNLCWK